MAVTSPSAPHGSIKVFLPAFVLIFMLSTLWALATPVFASPDENAHAVKAIAQAHGELLAHQRAGIRFPVYDLPDTYRYSPGIVCFAFNPKVSASCGVELGTPKGTAWFDDWVSSYNPVYYYAVGWPSLLLTGSAGIYGMRIVSALLCSLLLALAFVVATRALRSRWMPVGLAFFAAPMSLFLMGSINPQGAEFSGAALLTVALIRLVEKHRDPDSVTMSLRSVWLLTTVGAAVLAMARATGPLWVVTVIVGVLLAVGWRDSLTVFRRRGSIPWIAVIAAFGIFSLGWTLVTGTLAGQAEKADAPLVGGSFLAGAWSMLRGTPGFIESAIGVFGWQDTQLPPVVYGLCFGAVAVVIVLALFASRLRERRVVLASLFVAVLVPVAVQAASVSKTGIIWQGRYGLFLYLGVLLIAAWALSKSGDRVTFLSAPVSAAVSGAIALYGIAAFVIVLRRYVVGTGHTLNDMVTAPQWQPPLGWPLLTALLVAVSVAFAAWNALNAYRVGRREDVIELRNATHGIRG